MKLDSVLALYKLPENWDERAPHYRTALADVPPDLVEIALRHAVQNYKWLPQPSELREPIARMLRERQQRHAREAERRGHVERQLADREQWMASWPSVISEDDRADHDRGRVLSPAEVHEHFTRANPDDSQSPTEAA